MRASQAKGDRYEEGYKSGYKDATMEFVEDLVLNLPMIGFKYNRKELIKKWEEKLK